MASSKILAKYWGSGQLHLTMWVLVQIATSREATKDAKGSGRGEIHGLHARARETGEHSNAPSS
ncbi:protein of unknown function [Methanoculleus bourgensis]|uniref:Uncharacterized protein n=1 Tax=Methanoculleus bourgensis TaxID=83986 RepID=A0A0X3BLT4_9EURY|nr:protein of unknown function [Methanoculleus bourgensis]